MNHSDPKDSRDNDNDFLSGALHGAADQMPGGEVDDLHVSFGVVRDRVRRRRAAKIGGLTGASLVLVAGIAFGATQTAMLDRGDPVLPGMSESATPEPSGEATRDPGPDPTGPPATSIIQDEYVPSWLDGMGLACGMPAADLETTAPGWSIASAGQIYARTSDLDGDPSTSWGMAASVDAGDGSLDAAPVLVWSQDGVVVDLGVNTLEAPGQREPLYGVGEMEAQGGAMTSCAPTEGEAGDRYETQLPEGNYEVHVVAFPEYPENQWGSTVVSLPVAVRIDADGAHSPTGARGGASAIEPPDVAAGEISRFELDRTTDWTTAEQTQRGHLPAESMSLVVQCESATAGDVVSYDVVRPSTDESLDSVVADCDGTEVVANLGVLAADEEAMDIRLGTVPDGVSRLWAVLAPAASTAAGDCSASGMDLEYDSANSPSEGAGRTAAAIVDAAQACDPGRLIELANQYGTQLMIPFEEPEVTFALPEGGTEHYRTLAALLVGTGGAVNGGDPGNETITWPRVVTAEFRDSDEAWQEVVEAGLITAEQAATQRADEQFGYQGLRIGIAEDGTWRYYSGPD